MNRLSGKIAVVTGASKGIGAGIAKGLAAEGAAVVVNYASSKNVLRPGRRVDQCTELALSLSCSRPPLGWSAHWLLPRETPAVRGLVRSRGSSTGTGGEITKDFSEREFHLHCLQLNEFGIPLKRLFAEIRSFLTEPGAKAFTAWIDRI
jgi:short subunit dehydrogenase